MLAKKRHPFIFIINVLLFLSVILLGNNGVVDFSIKNATPFFVLPLLCAFAMFNSFEGSVAAGLLSGIIIDSVSVKTYCFNAIIFVVLSTFINLASNSLFNKNLKASIAVSVIVCFSYFIAYWLVFMAFGVGIENSLLYLLEYGIPSAVYSAVFVIPFYFLYRYFDKIKN